MDTTTTRERAERTVRHRLERWGFPDLLARLGDLPDPLEIKVEERREPGAVVIRAELPGIDPERDVEVTVDGGMLRIDAHREERTETGDPDAEYRSEFTYGQFTRLLALPAGATAADVTATYGDGILEVRVPVDERSADRQRVPVTRR